MPQLKPNEYYDAVLVPGKCGFYRKVKADGTPGALYLRVQMRCADGDEFPYPYWVSGKMAESLRIDLPKMGVLAAAMKDRDFYKNAGKYIKPVECQFGTAEEEYNGKVRLKIKGVYFNAPKEAGEGDIDQLMAALSGAVPLDPFTLPPVDDDVPF